MKTDPKYSTVNYISDMQPTWLFGSIDDVVVGKLTTIRG